MSPLAVAAVLPVVLAAQQPTFKAGTQVVPLYVTVVDADKRLVADLGREDFEVFDNGKPVTLTLFSNEPEAFSVVAMLDTSGSMTLALDLLKDAAEQFVIRLLPEDRGMLGAFSDKIQFPIATFTSDRDELAGAIKELGFGNSTRLYDAIEAGIQQLREVQGRRVVLVFTDGDDTASKIGMGKVLDQARADEVMIYTIGLESEYFNGQYKVRTKPGSGTQALVGRDRRRLLRAEDRPTTSGRPSPASRRNSTASTCSGFRRRPTASCTKLEVRVKKLGMVARARKSYLAPTSGTQ